MSLNPPINITSQLPQTSALTIGLLFMLYSNVPNSSVTIRTKPTVQNTTYAFSAMPFTRPVRADYTSHLNYRHVIGLEMSNVLMI